MSEPAEQLRLLQRDIAALLDRLADAEQRWRQWTEPVADEHRRSAINMVHYWALRQVDLTALQSRLAEFGLSSLGRSEAHVQATLAGLGCHLGDARTPFRPAGQAVVHFEDGRRLLECNAEALLGPAATDRAAPDHGHAATEAATDRGLVDALIAAGMRIARINCCTRRPSGGPRWPPTSVPRPTHRAGRAWSPRTSPARSSGPALEPGPKVVSSARPETRWGRPYLRRASGSPTSAAPAIRRRPGFVTVPVDGRWLKRRAEGEEVVVRDARGSNGASPWRRR